MLSNYGSFRKSDPFPWVSGGFLERRIPGKNGEGSARTVAEWKVYGPKLSLAIGPVAIITGMPKAPSQMEGRWKVRSLNPWNVVWSEGQYKEQSCANLR